MSSSQTLSGSFSLHSLAEGSEAISEADEIHEVRNLKEKGDKAFKKKNFAEALKFYNDALEIDENTVEALSSRAAVYIEMGNYILAQQDAERLLALRPQLPKGHFQLGVALDNLGQYRDALLAFLHAMDLDSNTEHMDIIASNIASLATHFCKVPEKLMEKLSEMDSYKKLCEMGACLYQNKRYELAIKVLVAAQRVQTNQKGITMKVQLTLANAHSILKHRDLAISLYQECLATAISAHDAQYQTKALVNIASLYLEAGDTHQAIVYYEKLMDLQKEIQGEDKASLPEYWNQDMECALHLNLSIGYKAIGNMHKAVIHAKKYAELIKDNDARKQAEGKSYHNVGVLNEILGNFQEALDSYQEFLRLSKQKGDQPGVAQAYACLGSIYATLKNRPLSLTFHEQSISLSKKLQDARLITNAYEQMGDTYMKFEETNEAIECYMSMFRSCLRNDVRTQTNALCKLGLSYKEQMRYQYSLYYYEQAKIIAEDFDFADIKAVCEYNIACILQHSTQMYELDQAKNYFEKLIPLFEAKITQHNEEDTFCPKEFHEKHLECYDGMINVLAKLGKKEECLVYAESYRRFFAAKQLYNPALTLAGNYSNSQTNLLNIWNIDKITRTVSQQNATVLYFGILSDQLLVWVLQPGVGLEQFVNNRHKRVAGAKDLNRKLGDLIKHLTDHDMKTNIKYAVDHRLLPLCGGQLEQLQKQNQKMSETLSSSDSLMDSRNSSSQNGKDLTPERELYDLLFAPIEYFLSHLDDGHPVIIVPDKSLFNCPFGVLEHWNGKQLRERFQLTCLQSLFLLDKVVSNELQQLKAQDELEFERNQQRLGGTAKNVKAIDYRTVSETPNTLASPVDDRSTKKKKVPTATLR